MGGETDLNLVKVQDSARLAWQDFGMDPEPCPDTTLVRPFDLDKAGAAKDINGLLNSYVTVMDTKASAFLAGNVAAATFLLRDLPPPGPARIAYITAMVFFAASTIVAGGVIFPRVPPVGNSVLFWGDIARQPDFRSYQQEFIRIMENGQLDEQYCVQNWGTARVLRRKFKLLRTAILLFFIALFSAVFVYLSAS